ncbi:MAG: hypothetical protein H0X36_04150 [Sphingomonadaceae bacterium]|nr:hypothetical protein [Sphingomonadaceae bacterium]
MKAQTMRRLRQLHHYVGMFFAPAVIFFALSGALQTFRLQEASGFGGPPPGWIVWMASVHKDQSLPQAKPTPMDKIGSIPGSEGPTAPPNAHKHNNPRSAQALKIFVALLAAGLIISSLLGITIALNNRATRRISLALLTAGALFPLLFLMV